MHATLCCLVQAVFFGAVALMALRMKFFWTPYMCIIASVLLANRPLWAWLLSQLRCHSDFVVCMLQLFGTEIVVEIVDGLVVNFKWV